MAFTAKYGGECAYGDYIQPGDLVTYTADDEIAHHGCEQAEAPANIHPDKAPKLCPECNLQHAGECF